MLSLLAQRVAFRLPALAAPTLLRSCAPLLADAYLPHDPAARLPGRKGHEGGHEQVHREEARDRGEDGREDGQGRREEDDGAGGRQSEAQAQEAKEGDEAKAYVAPHDLRGVAERDASAGPIIRAADRPPKSPGSPWLLFWRKFTSGVTIKSLEDTAQHIREASAIWKNMTDAEKKPFQDEYAAALTEYTKARDEWSVRVDQNIINELNRRKLARNPKGRPIKRNRPEFRGRPLPGYVRWMLDEFRPQYLQDHPEAKAPEIGKAAGAECRRMSDSQREVCP